MYIERDRAREGREVETERERVINCILKCKTNFTNIYMYMYIVLVYIHLQVSE